MKRTLIAAALLFGMGGCLGARMGETPPVEFVRVPETKIVNAPESEPEVIAVFPSSCEDALRYADRMYDEASKIYAAGDKQLSLISDARSALLGDGDLGTVENNQRDLQGRTVGSLSALAEAVYRYDLALEECEEDQP